MRRDRPVLPIVLLAWAVGCDAAPSSAVDDGVDEDSGDGSESGAQPPPSPSSGQSRSLVDMDTWVLETDEEDPLAEERPTTVSCPAAAWGPEWGRLEIQTGACDYFSARQPSLVAMEAGDAIEVVAFHDRLDAPEPASGHLALLVGNEVVWERSVAIPAEAAVLEARVQLHSSWPEGTPIGLHLHNHGFNAWTVAEITVVTGG